MASAKFHYEVCYPEKDTQGDALARIQGAWIEVRSPGETEYVRESSFVLFPDIRGDVEVFEDGLYAVRHVIVGACAESAPSAPIQVSINVQPPSKPDKGKVIIPCPQDSSKTSTFHYDVVYPKNDIMGNPLLKIQGAWIELRGPGGKEYERILFTEFPESNMPIVVDKDGMYSVRHVIVGACNESDPSDPVGVSVDLAPPEQPDSGSAAVPCPTEGTARLTFPKK
jgi:hypothetical protein